MQSTIAIALDACIRSLHPPQAPRADDPSETSTSTQDAPAGPIATQLKPKRGNWGYKKQQQNRQAAGAKQTQSGQSPAAAGGGAKPRGAGEDVIVSGPVRITGVPRNALPADVVELLESVGLHADRSKDIALEYGMRSNSPRVVAAWYNPGGAAGSAGKRKKALSIDESIMVRSWSLLGAAPAL